MALSLLIAAAQLPLICWAGGRRLDLIHRTVEMSPVVFFLSRRRRGVLFRLSF
jgi:hypothetical protein